MARWNEDALDRLADIYVNEPTPAARDRIERCVQRINRQLATDPWSPGEDRGPGRRVWFTPPLMVVYDLPVGRDPVIVHVMRFNGGADELD